MDTIAHPVSDAGPLEGAPGPIGWVLSDSSLKPAVNIPADPTLLVPSNSGDLCEA